MKDIIIVVTTREYPCHLPTDYSLVSMPLGNDIVTSCVDLNNDEIIKPLKSEIDKQPQALKEIPDQLKRILVWNDRRATFCKESGFFLKVRKEGFKMVYTRFENNEARYHVYIAPCTNGSLILPFKREYTAAVVKDAVNSFKQETGLDSYERIIIIAHDKDIVAEDGCGPVARSVFCDCKNQPGEMNLIKVLKFQHEESDGNDIWRTFILPIKNQNLKITDCENLVSLVDSFVNIDIVDGYSLHNEVTNSYLKKINRELLVSHYPDLFSKENSQSNE